MTFVTRFAPSPTGPLHLGHAYSAMLAHDMAQAQSGTFLLRIEDIDRTRARPAWEAQIYEDLHWLGLSWPTPVMRQSDRLPAYAAALDRIWDMGLLYPCTCSRHDIAAAMSAPQEGVPTHGPDGPIYPGTCRARPPDTRRSKHSILRLDIALAFRVLDHVPLVYSEAGRGPVITRPHDMIETVGDVVLARRDMGTSYHLSVVLDDAEQGISDVVRGADLATSTPVHVLLQRLLGLPTPAYHHHRLIRDEAGKRLAKRDDARALSRYRADGITPSELRGMLDMPHPDATI